LQLRPEATGSEQDLGTQSIRLARAGRLVLAVEPDPYRQLGQLAHLILRRMPAQP
jgi:hypothetical protein